jgi:hypothetical protein
MPVVELVIPDLSEEAARACERACCADRSLWPLRLVRRGVLNRSWQLELVDADDGVQVVDPPARSRLAATVRELSRWFTRVDLVPSPIAVPVSLSPAEFSAEVSLSGLSPAHRYVVTCRRTARDVSGAAVLDDAWERIERWLVAHHPWGVEALRPGVGHAPLDPSWSPALRRSLKRHDGQNPQAGALCEGLELLSAAEVAASGCFAAGPDQCVMVDPEGRVITADGDLEAPSLESWLLRWAEELEAGEQTLDATGDIVLVR